MVGHGSTRGHHQCCRALPPSRPVAFRATAVSGDPSAAVPPSKAAVTLLHCAGKEGTVVRVALCLGRWARGRGRKLCRATVVAPVQTEWQQTLHTPKQDLIVWLSEKTLWAVVGQRVIQLQLPP